MDSGVVPDVKPVDQPLEGKNDVYNNDEAQITKIVSEDRSDFGAVPDIKPVD